MALLTISKALEILKVSKATLYRDMKLGKVSYSINNKGSKIIDINELIRFYGQEKVLIKNNDDEKFIPNKNIDNFTLKTNKNIDKIDNLKDLELLRQVLIEKDLRINDLKKTINILENQLEKNNLMLEHMRQNDLEIKTNVETDLENKSKKNNTPYKTWWKFWKK